MSMYKNIQDILSVLWSDETLLRLLYYMPEDIRTNTPDPLDETLPNILDIDQDWNIRNDVIYLTPKDDDLIQKRLCRIFAYLGDRDSYRGVYSLANQCVVMDVLCHADFQNGDMRNERIADRLNELFSLNNVTGIGKMKYIRGRVIGRTPSQYVWYQHIFEFGSSKK